MDWFYCADCGAVFPESQVHVEQIENRHYWLDDKPVERWCEYYCPECGSVDIQEAVYCDWCGDALRPEDLKDGLCELCRRERDKHA